MHSVSDCWMIQMLLHVKMGPLVAIPSRPPPDQISTLTSLCTAVRLAISVNSASLAMTCFVGSNEWY